jgi:hypothetical protein
LWNIAHLWLDAAGFLNPIKGPHHAIRDPNRTFIEVLSKVGNADKATIGTNHLYVGCQSPKRMCRIDLMGGEQTFVAQDVTDRNAQKADLANSVSMTNENFKSQPLVID